MLKKENQYVHPHTINSLSNQTAYYNALRNKRKPDDESLVEATSNKNYDYWLSQEDIADIARLDYNNFRNVGEENNADFDILGSPEQLYTIIDSFYRERADYKLYRPYIAFSKLCVLSILRTSDETKHLSFENFHDLSYGDFSIIYKILLFFLRINFTIGIKVIRKVYIYEKTYQGRFRFLHHT